MSFKTASAILRNNWLIQEEFAIQHLGLVMRMAQGESVDFGLEREEMPEPFLIMELPFNDADCFQAAVYGVGPSSNLSGLQPGSIAQINIIGPVLKYGDMCSYGMADHAALINRLAANGNVSGIILNIDSPGGQASGTAMLADAIAAAKKSKPVVAIIDDGIAASAGYWIAAAANEIYLTKKTDQVGSIGVYRTMADWYAYAEKQGLKIKDVYAPQSTDKNGTYREALKGNEDPMKEDLAEMASAFIGHVQTSRAGKLTSDEWNTGKMFSAKKAAKIGLVDGVKNYTQVVQRVQSLATSKQSTINSNNMSANAIAFAAVMAAAGITEIKITDDGFCLTEENLQAVEKVLTDNATTISGHQAVVDGLNTTISERDTTIQERDTRIQELESSDDKAIITNLQAQITEKDAKILKLENKPAKGFTEATKLGGDHTEGETSGANKYMTSYDIEAQKIREAREESSK